MGSESSSQHGNLDGWFFCLLAVFDQWCMQKFEIKVGEEYGLREAREPGGTMQHVRILEHVRGAKWRAEWIEPNPGLKDYVESKHLIVRWKERKAFLRDEDNERRLQEHNARSGYDRDDSPVPSAVQQVFESARSPDKAPS